MAVPFLTYLPAESFGRGVTARGTGGAPGSVPELRVGDLDEGLGPFAGGLAHQLGDALLRDNVFNQRSGQADGGARLEGGGDFGKLSVFGHGFQHHDGLPLQTRRGAGGKVADTAHAAVLLALQEFGVGLAQQVHLDGVVDGRHAVLRGDDARVKHLLAAVDLQALVVVRPGEKLRRAHHLGEGGFAPLAALAGVGDDALLRQPHENIAVYLGVNAQVVLPL